MKRLFKILVGLVLVLVLVVVGLQFFLNHGLNPAVRKALPKVSETLGVDVQIEDVSLNLFGGSLAVNNVHVANPEGFVEKDVFALERTVLDVGLRSLMQGVVEVSEATVKDAALTVSRNQAGDVNIAVIREGLPKPEPASDTPPPAEDTPPQPAPSEQPSEPAEMPKIQINQLAFNTRFDFVDHKTTNPAPNRLSLDLAVGASDVATFGSRPENEWGTVTISGGLHDKPEAFVTDIKARVAPVTEPLLASFSAEGSIMAIDMRELSELTDELGVASEAVDITLRLNVRAGAFLSGSELVAALRDAKLVGELKEKHDKVELPPEISLTIPVSGTLVKPVISIQQALTMSVLRNLAKNPDYILDNVTVDGKSLRERLSKALGGDGDKADADNAELEETVNEGLKKLGELFK